MTCVRCGKDGDAYVCDPCGHGNFCGSCREALIGQKPFVHCPSCPPEAEILVGFTEIKPAVASSPLSKLVQRKDAANQLYKAGRLTETIEAYTLCITEFHHLKLSDKKLLSLLYSNRALAYISSKMYSSAVQDCEASLTADPLNLKAQFRFARALMELGDYEKAEYYARKVLNAVEDDESVKNLVYEVEERKLQGMRERRVVNRNDAKSLCEVVTCESKSHQNEAEPLKSAHQAPQIDLSDPMVEIKTIRDFELILKKSIKPQVLMNTSPELVANLVRMHPVVISDPDQLVNFITAVTKLSCPDLASRYLEAVQKLKNLDMLLMMLNKSERSAYDKLKSKCNPQETHAG